MNDECRRVDERLDDWVDGTSAPAERARIERHLAACADCRRRAAGIESVVAAARALPRELDLPHDLLPGIRVAARPRPSRARVFAALGAAAAVGLAVVSAWLVPAPERDGGGPTAAAAPDAPFRRAAEEFRLAAAGLERSLETDRTLPAETRAVLDENLRILDAAIAEASRALTVRPADPERGRTLTALHWRKVDVLWRVTRLSERT